MEIIVNKNQNFCAWKIKQKSCPRRCFEINVYPFSKKNFMI